ncbi:MAG: mRNA interferase RelE/StbE [Hyphomicrobiales bacterium]|jgi:mRNA interferase RelE/StbE|nr:mRNA interferase RelE/StbE [Hyphomicrobiales bacterium]
MLALDPVVRDRIDRFLSTAVTQDPRRVGKALGGRLKGFRRYKLGPYRVMCRIEDERFTVVVVAAGHRDHIYTYAGR